MHARSSQHKHPPLESAKERERALARSKAKPPTLVGARTGHRRCVCACVCVCVWGRSANATHQAQHSRTHQSATKEKDVKAPAREALKRRDTTSSGSERVSSRAGRPRQNELRGSASEPLTHTHTHTQLVEPNTRRARAQVTKRGAKGSAPSGSEPRVKAPRVGGLSTTRPKGLGLRPKGLGGTKGSLQVVQALGLRPQGLEASQLPRVIKA